MREIKNVVGKDTSSKKLSLRHRFSYFAILEFHIILLYIFYIADYFIISAISYRLRRRNAHTNAFFESKKSFDFVKKYFSHFINQ